LTQRQFFDRERAKKLVKLIVCTESLEVRCSLGLAISVLQFWGLFADRLAPSKDQRIAFGCAQGVSVIGITFLSPAAF
jgi:hypothetical protein